MISSYPFVAFGEDEAIPADYYTPLLTRTEKPLAVAEGGIPSVAQPPFSGSEQGQVAYLNALNDQIGSRLTFWIYLLLSDLDTASWGPVSGQNGMSAQDQSTLGWFVTVGLQTTAGEAKPALATWDAIRGEDPACLELRLSRADTQPVHTFSPKAPLLADDFQVCYHLLT